MTGAFLRAKRDDKWQPIEVEHLTVDERHDLLGDRSQMELLRWLDVVCGKLAETETLLGELEQDGILERK